MPTDHPTDTATVAAVILDLVRARGPGKTICPSEAARRLAVAEPGPDAWRALMPAVHAAAGRLRGPRLIAVTQRSRAVDALDAEGPIRLGLPPEDD